MLFYNITMLVDLKSCFLKDGLNFLYFVLIRSL
jgi:hypothetical protein